MKILMLEEKHLIGEGAHRKCYIHPSNDKYCIKIGKGDSNKENEREHIYYKQLQKRNINWDSLSQYYGEIKTNLGTGDIYELIKDDNNTPSKTLEFYLNHEMPDGSLEALKKMETYLLDQRVITTTLKPKNIVLQKHCDQVTRAIIVDDIGNTEFIPLSTYSAFFATQKIKRKLKRFKKLLSSQGIIYS